MTEMTKTAILIPARDGEFYFVWEAYIWESEGGINVRIPASDANIGLMQRRMTAEWFMETCGWKEEIEIEEEA